MKSLKLFIICLIIGSNTFAQWDNSTNEGTTNDDIEINGTLQVNGNTDIHRLTISNSTNNGSNTVAEIYRATSTVGSGNQISWKNNNTSGTKISTGWMHSVLRQNTLGAENSKWEFQGLVNGTMKEMLEFGDHGFYLKPNGTTIASFTSGGLKTTGSDNDNVRLIVEGTNGMLGFFGDGGGGSDGQLALYENSGGNLSVLFQGTGNSYINTTGNIGIGTNQPNYKLEVMGTGTATTTSRIASGGHVNHRISRGNGNFDAGYLFYTGSTLDWRFQESANGNNLNIRDESAGINVLTFEDNTGNIGIGIANPSAKLDIKVGSTETANSINLHDGNYEIGSIRKLSSTDGRGLVISGRTENATTAQPTLILAGYTKDYAADNSYDAAVSIRGYNVDDNSTLQSAPIFKVLNGSSDSYFTVNSDGNCGIGTSETGPHKLAVEGTIGSREIKVQASGWYDFVFDEGYNLRSLEEVESYIETNKHLPEIPSENEVLENGIELGDMNGKLLQKIEELTLYMIEMNKEMKSQKEEINLLKSENQKLNSELTELKKGN